MVIYREFTLLTERYNEWVRITDRVKEIVAASGIRDGIVNVVTKHTTTGIVVNESLECLESDMEEFLGRIVPEDWPYAHARMLKDYGSTAGNPTGHLKSLLTGNHCHLLIKDGGIACGGAQDIYFCEFDGPARRTVAVQIMGNE